jgi:hypothetical protein
MERIEMLVRIRKSVSMWANVILNWQCEQGRKVALVELLIDIDNEVERYSAARAGKERRALFGRMKEQAGYEDRRP